MREHSLAVSICHLVPPDTFSALDAHLLTLPRFANNAEISGTTAITALVTPEHYVFANCGDSRAVLYFASGQVHLATEDHKPMNPAERDRIEAAGGRVLRGRVDGELALSRALGDFRYKRRDLISDPKKYKVSE